MGIPPEVKKYVNLGFSKSIQKVVGNCPGCKKKKYVILKEDPKVFGNCGEVKKDKF